jgi:MFS family permease
MGRRKPLYVSGCIIGVLAWLIIIFVPGLSLNVLTLLFLCAGFSSGCMIIGFAFVKESVPSFLAGTASGICNMGVMLGPMILQPAVGLILDLHRQGHMVDGIKQYSLAAYQLGFSLMLAWLILGAILILFTDETRCEQVA